jgi:ABC-type lipoprotein export system ATPase subunit
VVVTHERDIAAYARRLITFRDGRVQGNVRQAPRQAAADLAALESAQRATESLP